MDAMQLKVRAAFRRRPEACRTAPVLLPFTAMERQAQSWVLGEKIPARICSPTICPGSALMCLAGVLEDTSWHRRGGERKPRATAACGRGVCDHPERERGHWCLAGRGSCELVPGCATSRDDKAAVPRAQCTSVVSRWWLRGRGGRARVYMRSLRAPNNGFCRIPYQVRVHHVCAALVSWSYHPSEGAIM